MEKNFNYLTFIYYFRWKYCIITIHRILKTDTDWKKGHNMRLRNKSTYFKLGLTIFITGCALIVFFFTAQTVGDLTKYISIVVDVLKPFIIGFVLAYLMCPVYNACVRRLRYALSKKFTDQKKIMKTVQLVKF